MFYFQPGAQKSMVIFTVAMEGSMTAGDARRMSVVNAKILIPLFYVSV